jgi:antagonist of KipI
MGMKVIKPGILTTVQDLGRVGYQKYGVVVSGAMDPFALRAANILLGNDDNTPGLEITMIGPSLRFQKDAWISICGGDLSAKIDGITVPLWRPIFVKENSLLTFQGPINGCRAYLTVAGGFEVNRVMESSSTYIRGVIGGIKGRALRENDILTMGHSLVNFDVSVRLETGPFYATAWSVSRDIFPRYDNNPVIRIMRGREFELFNEKSQIDLSARGFVVSPQSDRMGFRLSGPTLQLREPYEMISEAVTAGTIQVPPDGDPILLMADRQTTGGYPRIAQVATVDLPILAQVKPNEKIQFVEITHNQAEKLYLQREHDLQALKLGIKLKQKEG